VRDQLLIDLRAWDAATGAADVDPMCETGGVLLGWRHDTGVYVSDILVVPDSRAKHTFYRRRHKPATRLLGAALADLPDGSPIGYVGEWHTHPAPTGPSWIDRREIRRISKRTKEAIGLLVCAYDAGSRSWLPTGLVARNGRSTRAAVQLRNNDGNQQPGDGGDSR